MADEIDLSRLHTMLEEYWKTGQVTEHPDYKVVLAAFTADVKRGVDVGTIVFEIRVGIERQLGIGRSGSRTGW